MVVNMNVLNHPSVQPSINLQISEVVLNVVLENLSSFREFQTAEFFVSGNAWQIDFRKTAANSLGIYLQSNNIFLDRMEKLIVASCNIRLISQSPTNLQTHEKTIDVRPFSSQNFYWGVDNFIAWDQLMNGYVAEDSCTLTILVKATPILSAARNKWLQFEELAFGGHAALTRKKCRMTIHQIHNVVGVSSPNILFNGSLWRIVVERREEFVSVEIINTTKKTCHVAAVIEVLSFDPNIQPMTVVNAMQTFNAVEYYRSWNILLEDLIDPGKLYMEDGRTFLMEIELEVGHGDGGSDN